MSDFQKFQEVLTEREIFFEADSFRDGTQYFRIPQKIQGGGLIDVIVIIEEDHVKIVIVKIATTDDSEKRIALCELFNDLNQGYKYFKFHIDSDGDILLEGTLSMDLRDGEFQPEDLLGYIGAALNTLKNDYPKIMKIIWS
jgi:hypothetical protein